MPLGSMILATFALGAVISTSGAARFILGGLLAAASLAVKSQAPQFVANWSPDSGLYYAQGDGKVRRIDVVDGDGRAPLRFNEISGEACATGECQLQIKNFFFRVLNTEEPVVCVEQSAFPNTPPDRLCVPGSQSSAVGSLWSEIADQGGVTLYAKDGRLSQIPPDPCGQRPWHACAHDADYD